MLNTTIKMQFVEVDPATVKPGDTIYVSNNEKSVPFMVLDVGNPFFLIENTRTHFASLYRAVKFYKEVPVSTPNTESVCQ